MNGKVAKRLRKKAIGYDETTYVDGRSSVLLYNDCKRKHYKLLKREYAHR